MVVAAAGDEEAARTHVDDRAVDSHDPIAHVAGTKDLGRVAVDGLPAEGAVLVEHGAAPVGDNLSHREPGRQRHRLPHREVGGNLHGKALLATKRVEQKVTRDTQLLLALPHDASE